MAGPISNRSVRSAWSGLLPLAALLIVSACEHPADPANITSPSGPGGSAAVFSMQATVGDLGARLDSGPARVRIVLVPDSLVARRIVVERPGKMASWEKVEGRVVSVARGATADTLTLDIGGLQVVVDSGTRLRGEHEWGDDDRDDSITPMAEFVMRLQADLTGGRHPFVEARRHASSSPEAPTDSSAFVARTIRLDDAHEAPEIEINVTGANFATNASPPPAAWLTVLARHIAIRDSSVIRFDLPRTEGVMDFGDTVTAVDTVAHTATLASGTVLRIVAGTEIETEGTGTFGTLPAVAAALAAKTVVLAHGRGLLESSSPTTFDVVEVTFRTGT